MARDGSAACRSRFSERPWLAIPTVLLYFSSLEGWVAVLAVSLAWSIWLVFMVEAVIMLSVVRNRGAWARGTCSAS